MSIISKVLYRTMISAGGILEKKFNKYTLNSKSVNEEVLFKKMNIKKKCQLQITQLMSNI